MHAGAPALPVTDDQRLVLEKLIRSRTAPLRDVLAARVLLMAADGFANSRIAAEVQVAPKTVLNWRRRFAQTGLLEFSAVRAGRGPKPSIPPEKVDEIVRLTLHEKPIGATHWSCRSMANRLACLLHDPKRNGTTTLFAALDVMSGQVIGECRPRHRHTEFLKFLKAVDREVPSGLQIHMVLDNYATHNHPKVRGWLERHDRFHLHFTPTSSSWLNMVETFFGRLTDKAIRRGVIKSVPDLISAIETFLAAHNADPKPFQWTATTDQNLEK